MKGRTGRQMFALAHPITVPDPAATDIAPYRAVRNHGSGLLLMTVLAVDR